MITEFKKFSPEDWMSFGGAAGAPVIARPDVSKWVSSNSSVDIVADAQGVCVVIFTDEFDAHNFVSSLTIGKEIDDIGDNEGPSKLIMEIATKALVAAEQCKNHLELAGALALSDFEVL